MTTTNDMTGPIPTQIGNLVNLDILSLGKKICRKFFRDRPIIHSNPHHDPLHFLVLPMTEYNDLSGPIPTQIGNLVNLDFLRLGKKSCRKFRDRPIIHSKSHNVQQHSLYCQ